MPSDWINAKNFSINSILLMARWILRQLIGLEDTPLYDESPQYRRYLGIVLAYHPILCWYYGTRCPESAERVDALVREAPSGLSSDDVRGAEIGLMDMIDTFIVYLYPKVMDADCPYIRDWDPERLLSITDFTDKVVLDVGSGTGRLAFAAASKARRVYASEPTDRLREHMRDRIAREGIRNMVVMDGTIEAIPFEDNTFDIAMSAHVVGRNSEREIANLTRVVKNGGYIIDCMGEDDRKRPKPREDLLEAGFTYGHYVSKTGGDVYRYWKQVKK